MNELHNRSELLLNARSVILDQENSESISHFHYFAELEENVVPGFLTGMLLPDSLDKKYYAYRLFSNNGSVWYGVCVYDNVEGTTSFTGWYNLLNIPIDEFQNVMMPEPYSPD